MTALDAALLASVGLVAAAAVALVLNHHDRCPRRIVGLLEVAALAAGALALLLTACGVRLTIDLVPSARTILAIGFYGGVVLFALLGLAALVAPWWLDRIEAEEAHRLTGKGDGLP